MQGRRSFCFAVCLLVACSSEVKTSGPGDGNLVASGGAPGAGAGGTQATGGTGGTGPTRAIGGSGAALSLPSEPPLIELPTGELNCPNAASEALTGDVKYGVGPHSTFELELQTASPRRMMLVQLKTGVCLDAGFGGAGGLGGGSGLNELSDGYAIEQVSFSEGAGQMDDGVFVVTDAPARLKFYPSHNSDYATQLGDDAEMFGGYLALVDVDQHEVMQVYRFEGRFWALLL